MTVRELFHLVMSIDGVEMDTEVVITLSDDVGDSKTYHIKPTIGDGWMPSNVLELYLGEFATG